ncbi:MAG: hypothetical protein NHB32_25085 [Fischerella sp. CENA71]|nr:hypothetical protein [Fischerella sp. CENA71]
MDCPVCGYKNLSLSGKFCIECGANITEVSNKPPDVQIQILQTLHNSEAIGIDVKTINADKFIINPQAKLDNYKDSFCSLVEWISEKSDDLKKLHPGHARVIFEAIRRGKNCSQSNSKSLDYTPLEIKVLELVMNFCFYYLNGATPRCMEFTNFTESDYYLYLNKLINPGEKIRVKNVNLSSLIYDKNMSELVKALEKNR